MWRPSYEQRGCSDDCGHTANEIPTADVPHLVMLQHLHCLIAHPYLRGGGVNCLQPTGKSSAEGQAKRLFIRVVGEYDGSS